jgi:hypothetical protein
MVVSMHNHNFGGKLIREVTVLSKTNTSGLAYLSISPVFWVHHDFLIGISDNCYVACCLLVPFSINNCIVCHSNNGLRIPLCNLQTFRSLNHFQINRYWHIRHHDVWLVRRITIKHILTVDRWFIFALRPSWCVLTIWIAILCWPRHCSILECFYTKTNVLFIHSAESNILSIVPQSAKYVGGEAPLFYIVPPFIFISPHTK